MGSTALTVLGKGAYGQVLKLNSDTAIKLFKNDEDDIQRSTVTEIAILNKLKGTRNCLYLKKAEMSDIFADDVMFGAEIPLGDSSLSDVIKKEGNRPSMDAEELKEIMWQVTNGIKEIHERDIVHLDLKLENVIRVNGVYKVADFGLSLYGYCTLEGSYINKNLVTPSYRPPEIEYE